MATFCNCWSHVLKKNARLRFLHNSAFKSQMHYGICHPISLQVYGSAGLLAHSFGLNSTYYITYVCCLQTVKSQLLRWTPPQFFLCCIIRSSAVSAFHEISTKKSSCSTGLIVVTFVFLQLLVAIEFHPVFWGLGRNSYKTSSSAILCCTSV